MKIIPNLTFHHRSFFETKKVRAKYTACPECKDGYVSRGTISCPDGTKDCLELHSGYGCDKCKKVFDL